MTHISEALKKEHPEKKEYLQNELKSLGIVEPDHLHNEPNHKVGRRRRSFKHWQKASSQSIFKLTRQHIAAVVLMVIIIVRSD